MAAIGAGPGVGQARAGSRTQQAGAGSGSADSGSGEAADPCRGLPSWPVRGNAQRTGSAAADGDHEPRTPGSQRGGGDTAKPATLLPSSFGAPDVANRPA